MFRLLTSALLAAACLPSLHGQLPPTPLVQHGDAWHYRKGTSEAPADWHSVADATPDASWATGPGGFGYGDDMGVQFPVGGLPDMPTNLQATYFDGNEATLTWSDPGDLESGFLVEQSADGSTWEITSPAPPHQAGKT